ncbi:polymorphic toxin type 23 domain-containing protein [Chryseobacterium gallinarum]|uniref:Bacterial toxin 23 domain-containing protein n=1 Tax=Chryseobacterium gallinarum TaxID=1324352 RepID=A0ABX6KSQ4_CHRGL|nr:polymorphic toxin type 23 domain-containing protein [Chryseobacterium gallinarum]QIY91650.1 hypothetical protein FOB44_13755 [Chryseobacterium gallinarum]
MKIISSFILSICSVVSFSQTILYQAETTSRTVQDPQSVVFAQGFIAKSDISNPFIAKIGPATENAGGSPVDSNAGTDNPSGASAPTGQSFHDTKGNIEVTGGGQLQFTLPIALPPGVKSVAPQINLVYSSDSGNGIAGYGWNLSGITAISRIGKNIEKDGEVKSIQIDYSDYYSFNGQRLILKSGEYGKDGAEYVTEKYSNIKIKSLGNIPNWKQPEYWEVTFEDGSQAWYGGVAPGWNNATNRLGFSIVKWKDTQGNVINYNYDQEYNVNVIRSITWGGNENLGTASFNEIVFNYNDRNIPEGAYINGSGTLFTQTKILKDIIVKISGQIFKKYVPEYFIDSIGYQYIKQITESNSKGEPANPVVFNYPVQNPTSVSGWNMDSQALFDKVKFTGDFNGDAYLDFIMTDGTIKLGVFNDDFNVVQTNKIFNSSSVVVNTFLDETGKVVNGNGVAEYEKGKISVYAFRNNTFVKVFEKLVYDDSDCIRGSQPPPAGCKITTTLNEGDSNGDGISDIFVTIKREECYWAQDPNCNNTTSNGIANRPPPCSILQCASYTAGNLIVDLKNQNSPLATYTLVAGINESLYTDQKYMDIDSDGKVDIINVSNTAYTIFEFVKTAPDQYLKKIKFTGNLEETKGNGFPVLFGDFNGDGKLDFALPLTEGKIGKDDWKFYIGTGKSFNTAFRPDFLMYKNENTQSNGAWLRFSRTMYSITDLNADGKSDIVQVHSYSNSLNSTSRTMGVVVNGLISKGAASFGAIDFTTQNIYTYPTPPQFNIVQPYDDLSIYQPITNVIRSNNNYYNVFLFRKDNVLKIKAPTGVGELKRIQSITQGGVTTSAKYLEIIPDNTVNPNFYKNPKNELYPYFSLPRIDRGHAVSQLQQENRKQDFRYRGMTMHMQGKGMIGYYQTARSSWYADGFENTKIWTGAEIDPLNEGVPAKEWSVRTNNESLIFPDDLSENNTHLLSFKSITYQTDKLLNNQVVSSVADNDKPKVVTAIVPKTTKTRDFLTNTVTNSTVSYDNYYLPIQTVSNVNNGYAVTTSTFDYTHNPSGTGPNYYIGRPKSKTDIVQAYGDTKSAREEYTYENNLLKTLKTWNRDNSGYVQETYIYDGFGNITQKTISNSMDSQTQTTNADYDPKGRFVIKKTDNLGLQTGIVYNVWGQILTQADPLGNILTNTYDNWGKLLTSKTNLAGTTTYQYERDNNANIMVTQYDPDGNISKKFTNKLGQEYKISSKAFGQGKYISKETQYDILGRKLKESESYFEGQSAGQWNTMTYDDSVFPAKITAIAFNGKQMETSVSGLITTVKELNGYGRTTSKTADALGNVVSTTDKGGSIQFSYNAAGEQIKAQYAENTVITKYDSWGRKSEFNDPSNGVYKYEYDGFGQPKKTISPKGTKEYIYNNLGQLISQKELSTTDGGQTTNKTISFTYDNKGRVISKSGTSKGNSFSSNVTFDPQGRILSSSESGNGKYFIQKGITYDDKARVISYEKQLYSSGILTKIQIENVYSAWNGELYQVKDKVTGKTLWELKETNAKGQVLKSRLGAADVNNTYDANGFLTNVNHSSAVKPSILQLSYSFDAIKNELKSRTTGGDFNITESFDYDDNNRLVNWTNPVTGVKPTTNRNVYDIKGRITQNDQVGTIKFENSQKIYQPTGMTLNAAGVQNYNNDLIQSISYNENNDPVFIDGEKGDAAFQYGLTPMRQRVTYGGNFSSDGEGKFTKYYSEDGSYEIVKDNTTGKEKHFIYIGGTPYESNIVYLKDFTESSGSYKFLHKDYLGSILAISDEAGNKLEQRHFDAWGGLAAVAFGNNGAVITDKNVINNSSLLLDRGYTSHEHFAEVGIIHMNGRLYDPLLRRFLNADENIQDPYNTQNYNKYGYVMNNPLMYNDPSGEFFVAGFFLSYIAPIIWGAIVGTAIAGTAYLLTAAFTQNFTWGGFGKALLMGAVGGAVTGLLNPGLFFAGGYSFLGQYAGGVISSIMPAWNINIGNFSFGISPSIAFGKGLGFGANVSATFQAGDFALSAGFGIMNYGAHAGSGESGWEFRKSAMFSYNSRDFGISLGTNIWSGLHPQQTGVLGLRSGDFSISYENDGSPFAPKKWTEGILADNNDRWRTAAMTIGIGDFSAGFNLFTGERLKETYDKGWDDQMMDYVKKNGPLKGVAGAAYPQGFAYEQGPTYRLGAAYVGYKNMRIGINSDRYIRHPIQNIVAHGNISKQPGFLVLTPNINPYFQYRTKNQFTSW